MANITNEQYNKITQVSYFQNILRLDWLHKLFFISLSFLFIAIVTNFKRHLALDLTGFLAIICLIRGKINTKEVLKQALPLLCLAVYACLKPCINNEYLNFGIRTITVFSIGFAAEVYLKNTWKLSGMLSSASITIALILYWLGFYHPADCFVENRLTLTMHPAAGLMAYVALEALLLSIYAFINISNKIKFLLIPCSICCLIVMVLAASQTSILGLLSCLFYYACYLTKHHKKKLVLTISAIIIIVGIIFGIYGKDILLIQRIHMSLTNKTIFLRLSARTPIWGTVLDLFKKHPVFGTSNSYQEMNSYLKNKEMQKRFHYNGGVYPNDTPHNLYLAMLHYYGLIGVFFFFWLITNNIIYAKSNSCLYFIPIIVSQLTTGFLDYHWATTHGIFFYFFAMGTCYATAYKKSIISDEISS